MMKNCANWSFFSDERAADGLILILARALRYFHSQTTDLCCVNWYRAPGNLTNNQPMHSRGINNRTCAINGGLDPKCIDRRTGLLSLVVDGKQNISLEKYHIFVRLPTLREPKVTQTPKTHSPWNLICDRTVWTIMQYKNILLECHLDQFLFPSKL